ncbi:unnamed protein product, partial [Mesorhabditis belari]|uniref:PAP-associated domain-containing protein n=1 Tax=Mesorhabditis belari TaxID=2138241 RepID=A0AAF3EIB4_9BILA
MIVESVRGRDELSNYVVDFHLYGSTVTGFGSKNSDLDVFMNIEANIHSELAEKDDKNGCLEKIKKILRRSSYFDGHYREVVFLAKAKVPIISMTLLEKFNHINVDISASSLEGVHNSYLFKHYNMIDERFAQLYLMVKEWATVNDICNSQAGSLNGFCYCLLVLHFLQSGVTPPILPNLQKLFPEKFAMTRRLDELQRDTDEKLDFDRDSINESTIGELFLGFFEYYKKFSWKTKGISIRRGETFLRPNENKDYVYVENVFSETNAARVLRTHRSFKIFLYAIEKMVENFSKTASLDDILKKIEIPKGLMSLKQLDKENIRIQGRKRKITAISDSALKQLELKDNNGTTSLYKDKSNVFYVIYRPTKKVIIKSMPEAEGKIIANRLNLLFAGLYDDPIRQLPDNELERIAVFTLKNPSWTEIHLAAALGLTRTLSFLFERDAVVVVNTPTEDGLLPLHIACEYNQYEAAMLCTKAGAQASKMNARGQTAYHLAAKSGDMRLMKT